ncbi:GNAT family N-acetyltransferase [Vibrio sp. SM6]|uniref:GNAT family N-acetyltransferase n=1 Tax=Vibrio agarilyticus TaxID=2726741 RepID=A0A7X8TU63_9VIBR|nr:GNAT family N-acetyltransferase [Vibrio agarilyticus]NLS14868.1 GNAT family N-acetyltransferase [Vibrio agarilyticus]
MKFRRYHSEDKQDLIDILLSNCPKYFIETDQSDLIDFLDNYADENYLVVESNGKIIGCGGHFTKGHAHGIAWVMFGQGTLGPRQLLSVADTFYREIENRIKSEGHLYDIHISTTQKMENLFNRYGFETVEITKNGFGQGLHQYDMVKSFTF